MAAEIISIVSGGWSAGQVDLASIPGFVIGVNNAALHVPRRDSAISMDRRWAEAYWPWAKAHGEAGKLKLWLRPNNILNIPERPDWLKVYNCNHRSHLMSDEPDTLNGTNSGGVALNLAYSLKPRMVYLFGFDYRPGPRGEWHWFETTGATNTVGAFTIHPGRYAGWAREFSDVALQFRLKGIEVLNVSAISTVTAFRKITPKEFSRIAA